MLVLSRKDDQEIHLPDLNVVLRILKTNNGHVKIGIKAPKDIRILRGELNEFGSDDFTNSSLGFTDYADGLSFA